MYQVEKTQGNEHGTLRTNRTTISLYSVLSVLSVFENKKLCIVSMEYETDKGAGSFHLFQINAVVVTDKLDSNGRKQPGILADTHLKQGVLVTLHPTSKGIS